MFKIVIENPGKLSDLAYRDGLCTAAGVTSARLLTLTLYDPKRRSSNDAQDFGSNLLSERMLA